MCIIFNRQYIMGPKNSHAVNNGNQPEQVEIRHPHFKKVKTVKGKDSSELEISVPVVNETQIKQWSSQYKKFISWECLLLPISHQFKSAKMCGSSGNCVINYDYYPFLLRDEISDRCQNSERKYFANPELWYLTFTIVEAAHIFHMGGKKVGDIRPLNIFVNDNGQVKVANYLSWPSESNNYQKVVYNKEITYLSPEQMVDLNFGQIEPRGHFQICQAFSIGLTLLDSAILSSSEDLYNLTNNRFNYERLDAKIKHLFSLPYLDQNLKFIIAGFCHLEPTVRLTSRMVYQWLLQYKNNIVEIEPFEIKQIPTFLQNPAFHQPISRESLTKSPVKRVVQPPVYVESQVVSNSPKQVLIAKEGAKFSSPLPIPVQSQELSNQPQENQIVREVFHQPPPPPQIVQQQPVIVERRVVNEERKIQLPYRQIGPSQVVDNEVPKSVAETKIITRTVEPPAVKTTEIHTIARPVSRPNEQKIGQKGGNYDQFRVTLDKIEEQLALSRKMYPS